MHHTSIIRKIFFKIIILSSLITIPNVILTNIETKEKTKNTGNETWDEKTRQEFNDLRAQLEVMLLILQTSCFGKTQDKEFFRGTSIRSPTDGEFCGDRVKKSFNYERLEEKLKKFLSKQDCR